ncbi:MAG: MFS transporter, partial [Candidatus Binataceae bacterium]
LDPHTVATIAIIYNVGALIGGLVFGYLSDHWGRRRAMILAVLIGLVLVPLWIFPRSLAILTVGAFLMQFVVQGAWGVIPAHLIELSPPEVRGLFPGLAYQIGVLIAGNAALVEAILARHLTYGGALALVASTVLALSAIVIALGNERKGSDLQAVGA